MVDCWVNKNLLSLHCLWSVRKSGNDLWKIWMGSSEPSGIRRREWREWRVVEMLDTPRRSESALIERGLNTSNTVPTTALKHLWISSSSLSVSRSAAAYSRTWL